MLMIHINMIGKYEIKEEEKMSRTEGRTTEMRTGSGKAPFLMSGTNGKEEYKSRFQSREAYV